MSRITERQALFPFTDEARDAVSQYQLEEVVVREDVQERSLDRLRDAFSESDSISDVTFDETVTPEVELLSYPVARVLLSLIDEYRALSQYTKYEAALARKRIEERDMYSFEDIAVQHEVEFAEVDIDELIDSSGPINEAEDETRVVKLGVGEDPESGVDSKYPGASDKFGSQGIEEVIKENRNKFHSYCALDMESYLRYSTALSESKWLLPNRSFYNGRILVSSSEFSVLVEESIRQKISENLPIPEKAISQQIDKPREKLERLVVELHENIIPDDLFTLEIDTFERECLPPAINAILTQAREEGHLTLSHEQLFTVAAFLVNVGLEDEEIIQEFGIPEEDVNSALAGPFGDQLEHIRTKGGGNGAYTPPTYDTIRSWGFSWESDSLEEQVSHPLQYYRIKLEEQNEQNGEPEEDEEDDSEE